MCLPPVMGADSFLLNNGENESSLGDIVVKSDQMGHVSEIVTAEGKKINLWRKLVHHTVTV